jgi:hypothetical protein
MQLPNIFNRFVKPEKPKKKYYLTLIFDSDNVAGSCWSVERGVKADLTYAVSRRVRIDNWEERLLAADEVITALENKLDTEEFHDVILGLPSDYLTAEGDIAPLVRVNLKEITKELDLTPIGFVSLNQAIVYKMKVDEGVPPSVILINVNHSSISVFIYKVGTLVGYQTIPNGEEVLTGIDKVLKDLLGNEVLPAKISLFGPDNEALIQMKENLIGYPWTSKLNFLHFPKIVILAPDFPVTSVSMAGAGELAKSFKNSEEESNETEAETDPDQTIGDLAKSVKSPEIPKEIPENPDINRPGKHQMINRDAEADFTDQNTESELTPEIGKNETAAANLKIKSAEITEKLPATEIVNKNTTIADALNQTDKTEKSPDQNSGEPSEDVDSETDEDDDEDEMMDSEEETNVRVVSPEEFGFKSDSDILEKPKIPEKITPPPAEKTSGRYPEAKSIKTGVKPSGMKIFDRISQLAGKISLPKFNPDRFKNRKLAAGGPLIILAILIVVGIAVGWLVLNVLPKANVEISVETKTISETSALSIDPASDSIDPDKLTIPGKKLERTISGEKTINTTGRKKIGDPAKGTVTIYNKVLSSKTFKKGTVLTTGGVKFTLDSDVQIASASESVGSITFGKGNANVTAADIGTQGNVSSGSEFSFSDVSPSAASARNDQAFSGGTSKEISVVSRADNDAIVKAISADLIEQAKSELGSSSSGTVKLIDSTIKTSVSDKKFSQEVDEESKQLHATVSVLVSGTGYDMSDVQKLMLEVTKSKIPSGYEIETDKITTDINKVLVSKTGKITGEGSISFAAVPRINENEIKKLISGKNLSEAESAIKQLPGVSGVQTQFQSALIKTRLPSSNNITISVKVQP